jgi:hypothetical protein
MKRPPSGAGNETGVILRPKTTIFSQVRRLWFPSTTHHLVRSHRAITLKLYTMIEVLIARSPTLPGVK